MSSHRRPGYNALIPYLVLEKADAFLDFCREVLGMAVEQVERDESGAIQHSVLRLDDSILEVSDTRGERAVRPAMLHLYLADIDGKFAAAQAAGCEVVMPPTQMPYGERSCGLRDPWGVEWWLAEFNGESSEA